MSTDTLPYRAILFDLEGTLVDFQWNLKGAAAEILGLLSKHGIDPDAFGANPDYACLFNTTQKRITAWPQARANELIKKLNVVYNKYDADALSRWQPYPDTIQVLDNLFASGCRMGLVTNCCGTAVNRVLEKFDLASYFELVISRNDIQQVKPHPEGLIAACRTLDLPPEDILFVGDSVNDILPANEIGMPSCFLNCGECQITGNHGHHADHEISSLAGLYNLYRLT